MQLFLSHRRELINYAAGIVRDRDHAEDVVQEAYLRFDSAAVSQPLAEPVGYLYRVVRNLAVDGRRSRYREELRLASDGEAETAQVQAGEPSPETIAVDRDELRLMRAALAELPERTRIALEMHRLDGHTLKDIAAHLGISIGLAHRLVADGLDHCRHRLQR